MFSNSISSQILSSLPEKAEIYKNLKKVEELLNSVNKKEENGLEEIRDAIIWVRLFTGRSGKEEIDSKPYIRKNLGFSVDEDYVIFEQEYCDTYDTLQKSVETAVRKYVQENNIQSKTPYFIVNEKAVFEPAQWCKNTFDDYKGVLEVIYNSFEENRKSVDLLENLIVKIGTYFERFQSQCKESLKQIESLFGRKLTDYLEQEKWHYSDIEYIRESLSEVESNLSQQLSEIQESLNIVESNCDDTSRQIDEFLNGLNQ